jgi:ribulose 1,5-bisphosphate synthetase/thiazole synthase
MKRRRFLQSAVAGASLLSIEQAVASSVKKSQIAWTRTIPLRYEADVAVIGGGIAGATAACAAADAGARVILVERFAVTGGNLTTGGVASFCGETAGQGKVFDEILNHLQQFKAIAEYKPYPELEARVFDHSILAVVLQEMLLRRGVKLLLHTQFIDALQRKGKVTECIISGPSGPEALAARHFIDCTGEAALVHALGFETMKGRPQDGLQLPMSMMFFVRHVAAETAQPQSPPDWFDTIRQKDDLPMTSIWPNGPGANAIKIKIPMFDATDTESMTAAEVQGRRRMMQVLDYYQRVEKKPWFLDYCSPRIGIREGRRIVGQYVLNVGDLRQGKKFDDAVARGVFYLDGHKPDDDKRTYILDKNQLRVPPYHIPFRCLVVKDAKNLLAAGRCFSAEQLALSSARVSTTCAMMGQAAGMAAALAVQKKCDTKEIDPVEMRHLVEQHGADLNL